MGEAIQRLGGAVCTWCICTAAFAVPGFIYLHDYNVYNQQFSWTPANCTSIQMDIQESTCTSCNAIIPPGPYWANGVVCPGPACPGYSPPMPVLKKPDSAPTDTGPKVASYALFYGKNDTALCMNGKYSRSACVNGWDCTGKTCADMGYTTAPSGKDAKEYAKDKDVFEYTVGAVKKATSSRRLLSKREKKVARAARNKAANNEHHFTAPTELYTRVYYSSRRRRTCIYIPYRCYTVRVTLSIYEGSVWDPTQVGTASTYAPCCATTATESDQSWNSVATYVQNYMPQNGGKIIPCHYQEKNGVIQVDMADALAADSANTHFILAIVLLSLAGCCVLPFPCFIIAACLKGICDSCAHSRRHSFAEQVVGYNSNDQL